MAAKRKRSIEAFIVIVMMTSCVMIMMTRMLLPAIFGVALAEDKTLEMMLNVWFATGFVTTMQFFFGSSQGSRDKDEAKEEPAKIDLALIPPVAVVPRPDPRGNPRTSDPEVIAPARTG